MLYSLNSARIAQKCDQSAVKDTYGFRDQEFFTLKIFALHEVKYALIG